MSSSNTPFRIPKKKSNLRSVRDKSYKVVVANDPVNLMNYIMFAFSQIFGFSTNQSIRHVKEVQHQGHSVLWSGMREKAEHYVYLLQEWQLNAYIQSDE